MRPSSTDRTFLRKRDHGPVDSGGRVNRPAATTRDDSQSSPGGSGSISFALLNYLGSGLAHPPMGVRRTLDQQLESGVPADVIAVHQEVHGLPDDFARAEKFDDVLYVRCHEKNPGSPHFAC